METHALCASAHLLSLLFSLLLALAAEFVPVPVTQATKGAAGPGHAGPVTRRVTRPLRVGGGDAHAGVRNL
jgi:hypothetical protein